MSLVIKTSVSRSRGDMLDRGRSKRDDGQRLGRYRITYLGFLRTNASTRRTTVGINDLLCLAADLEQVLRDCPWGRFFKVGGWHRIRDCIARDEWSVTMRNVRQESDMD